MPEVRLIDANDFAEQYGNYYAEEGPEEGFIGTVGELIAKQPTVEPEVRHRRCEKARRLLGVLHKLQCCNCGARMDAEEINVLTKDGGDDNGNG